jgi:hypothetical protein
MGLLPYFYPFDFPLMNLDQNDFKDWISSLVRVSKSYYTCGFNHICVLLWAFGVASECEYIGGNWVWTFRNL